MRPIMTMNVLYKGGGQYDKKDTGEALFHGWGVNYEEFESGPGNYTVAIIERPDGAVETLTPQCIRFLDKPGTQADALVESLRDPIIVG